MSDGGVETYGLTSKASGIPVALGTGKLDISWMPTGNGASNVAIGNHTHPFGEQICLSSYMALPARDSEYSFNGFLKKIVDAGAVSSGSPLNVPNGIGKIIFVLIAGTDFAGTLTVTGTSVDRNTGAETGSDTENIVIDSLTTDDSTTDAEGNHIHGFTACWMTSKWWKGTVVLSTSDCDISDLDAYAVAFEQFGDNTTVTLDAVDLTVTNTAAVPVEWLYLYTYKLVKTATAKFTLSLVTTLSLASVPTGQISYRLRKGNLAVSLVGTSDGIFQEMYLGPTVVNEWEDLNLKVWATITRATSVYS